MRGSIQEQKVFLNSIEFKLSTGVMAVLLILVMLFLYNNSYTKKGLCNQVAVTERTMISLYLKQIDNQLEQVDKYLLKLAISDNDLSICKFYEEGDTRTLALARLINNMINSCVAYEPVETIFVYFGNSKSFIPVTAGGIVDFELRNQFLYFIEDLFEKSKKMYSFNEEQWEVFLIGNKYYLLHMLKTDDLCVGAWVSAQKLLKPLDERDYNKSISTTFFMDEDGNLMSSLELVQNLRIDLTGNLDGNLISGEDEKYIIVSEKSSKGNFSLLSVTPQKKVMEYYPYINQIYIILMIGIVFFIAFYILLLRKTIIAPINRLLDSMQQIRLNRWDTRVSEYKTSNEFKILNSTFNQMMEHIRDLKINIYEEKLKKQKAEYEHLKLQINPHFFLNSISIIYRLAQLKKYEMIQEMSICLLGYFRYVLRTNKDFVPIREELQHIQNYLRIQQLRMPGRFDYSIDVPDILKDVHIPTLLIHNFVENSIKYALSSDATILITIKAELTRTGERQELIITIEDSGPGFEDEILKRLKTGKVIIDKSGEEHIGIWNLKCRLEHLYNGGARIMFSNAQPSGAIVNIILPV